MRICLSLIVMFCCAILTAQQLTLNDLKFQIETNKPEVFQEQLSENGWNSFKRLSSLNFDDFNEEWSSRQGLNEQLYKKEIDGKITYLVLLLDSNNLVGIYLESENKLTTTTCLSQWKNLKLAPYFAKQTGPVYTERLTTGTWVYTQLCEKEKDGSAFKSTGLYGFLVAKKLSLADDQNKIQHQRISKNGRFEWKENGKIQNGLKMGDHITYFDDGKVQSKGFYIQGQLSGEYFTYFESGLISSQGNFLDGMKHGKFTFYNEKGVLIHDEFYHQDLKEGNFRSYYQGKIIEEIPYKKGIEQGWAKIPIFEMKRRPFDYFLENDFDEDDQEQLIHEEPVAIQYVKYVNALRQGPSYTLDFHTNDTLMRCSYFNDYMNGLCTTYENRHIQSTMNYKNGRLNGEYLSFVTTGIHTGKLYTKEHYSDGWCDGKSEFYFWRNAEDSTWTEGIGVLNYLDGERHGQFELNFPGKIKLEGNYKKGKRVGIWKETSFDGGKSFTEKGSYARNKKHGTWDYFRNDTLIGYINYYYGQLDSIYEFKDEHGYTNRLLFSRDQLLEITVLKENDVQMELTKISETEQSDVMMLKNKSDLGTEYIQYYIPKWLLEKESKSGIYYSLLGKEKTNSYMNGPYRLESEDFVMTGTFQWGEFIGEKIVTFESKGEKVIWTTIVKKGLNESHSIVTEKGTPFTGKIHLNLLAELTVKKGKIHGEALFYHDGKWDSMLFKNGVRVE